MFVGAVDAEVGDDEAVVVIDSVLHDAVDSEVEQTSAEMTGTVDLILNGVLPRR
ncbi:hypothetical protein SAMN04489716_6536 [Actinoplanes derwentensis]|uniref:Uncharacterized protein n=1 Tax=Actinoplanes derwentensis TaxID=113562 RepID=A0A1H2CRL7_9ACTN|nr:hypothetical protein Ade03nite_87750 [Actinoplanes derwentensis]SDT72969.1 hypothetical protein SAMN04489716_6536 [Actinoplanes derwentensis]